MAAFNKLRKFTLPLQVGDAHVEIAGMYRDGTGIPLVFLHGFGSTKEDYADVIQQRTSPTGPSCPMTPPGAGPRPAPIRRWCRYRSWFPSPRRSSGPVGSNGST
jgi:hypothetical protein